jgi:PEGA domain
MDFLDPKKQRAHVVRLLIGYVLVGITIVLATIVLLYLAYGFALDKGKIIQNGLVFVSSHPGGSSIVINGKSTAKTNTRLTLPAGTYTMQILRKGYRTWQRAITVEGDSVERFDYPFLIPNPNNLVTTTTQTFTSKPLQASQSPSRRWLLLETSGAGKFELYDLGNPKKAAITVNLPNSVLTTASTTAAQSLKVIDWSDDNRHVLLKHTYDKTYEYIVLDTQDPSKSLNLNKTLDIAPPVQVTLLNKQYDHYFVYNPSTKALSTANLSDTTLVPLLQDVLDYKSYGGNVVLYASDQNAPAGRVAIMLYQNDHSYHIRNVVKSSTYLLNLTQYSGSWYIAAGVPSENKIYVYKNPLNVLADTNPITVLVPATVLKVQKPTYVSFSASAQFIMAENANSFAVYDVQYDENYAYKVNAPMDKPQLHATWMDGDRLTYISKGKLIIFDYDKANAQTLMSADPAYLPFFDPSYKFVDALNSVPAASKAPATEQLTSTALLTKADQ